MCHNALPSLSNLWRRKVVRDVCYPRCGLFAETVDHALWWCTNSVEVWTSMSFYNVIARFQGLCGADVLRGLDVSLKKEALGSVCMVLWGIWQARNDIVQRRKGRSESNLVEGVLSFQKDFQASSSALLPTPVVAKAPAFWSPPMAGTLKLNTDASVKKGSSMFGVGEVIRDDKG
ncbi:hypothetical protein Dsin_019733 [Dipteronia sinensis]|uniref:Reverse transcriptase zinc-binding domain-containing protein n=1 Tax=Dipteronia sinensis TaxID=43782 RepID=A0AAE0A8A8_9ROSI|nr:hypothetical protein Dsin_019733 [Dipteronia sinensis]